MRNGSVNLRCRRCGRPAAHGKSGRGCPRPECGGELIWAFQTDIQAPGQKRKRTGRARFRTKREAEEALRAMQAKYRNADPRTVANRNVTVADYAVTFLKAAWGRMKASTHRSYEIILRLHVVPGMGSLKVKDVRRSDVQRVLSDLELAPKSVVNVFGAMRAMFTAAVEDGLISTNPASGAWKTRADRKPLRVWTPGETGRFLGAIQGHRMYLALRLAVMSGMRRGEVLGLAWDSVDFDSGVVHVRRALSRQGIAVALTTPKTGRARRRIELDEATVEMLRFWKTQQERERIQHGSAHWDAELPLEDGRRVRLVFTTPIGKHVDPDWFSQSFKRLVKKADVPNVTLHSLRHSAAARWFRRGESLDAVSRRLGHHSAAFSADVYSSMLDGHGAAIASADAAEIDGLAAG